MNEPESGNKYLPSKAHIPRTKFPVQWRDLVTTSVTRWDARPAPDPVDWAGRQVLMCKKWEERENRPVNDLAGWMAGIERDQVDDRLI